MQANGKTTIITGNGKGKTTSAMGLMVQAATAGRRIYFGQFMKQGRYSEIKMLRDAFPEITIDQYAGGFVIGRDPKDEDKQLAQHGITKAAQTLTSGQYDLIVLDEINIALFLELVTLPQVLDLIESKPPHIDLVLTGRYADPQATAGADATYEMLQVKHYYNNGVAARLGIEM
ncbi:MAG: cob(I)yrinic acid a,c-diamide adenosyltransferase [Defluviitaleaceae bacterium]|nr:cob(I)yrinic acid a,c-diamide adenosyltransferase [Defluviitaleaceae bacterium]